MKKLINTVAGLAVAVMSTLVTLMGITWMRGDCQDIFKVFGAVMIVVGIYSLARNFIKAAEQSYTKQ